MARALLALLLLVPAAQAQRAKTSVVVESAPVVPAVGAGAAVAPTLPAPSLLPAAASFAPSAPVLAAAAPAPAPATPVQTLAVAARTATAEPAALGAHYDGGSGKTTPAASVPGSLGPGSAPLPRSASIGPPAKPGVPAAPVRRRLGWRRTWELAVPWSRENTLNDWPFKDSSQLAREAAMHRHNLLYLLGRRERTAKEQEFIDRAAERERVRKERDARALAHYKLSPPDPSSTPSAVLGTSLGSGGQGTAYKRADAPGRVVKVFRDTPPEQLRAMAAILNAVADQGHAVARVKVVRTHDGWGLDMKEYAEETGWRNLATYARFHRDGKTAAAVRRAEDILFAVGAESKKALGIDAADWKTGLTGSIDDDHLENFFYNPETGELVCFDCLVKW